MELSQEFELTQTLKPNAMLPFSTADVLRENFDHGVLAVIIGTTGPSYRPLGAMMRIASDGTRIGTLSSGCIEADLVLHASDVLQKGAPRIVKYGQGSPFMDIKLPCGGGLEILLVPNPDEQAICETVDRLADRIVTNLRFDLSSGQVQIVETGSPDLNDNEFQTKLHPEPMFYILGKGPEASAFAIFVHSLGYPHLLLSPDNETLDAGRLAGCEVRHLKKQTGLPGIAPDNFSAVTLFFHDHDWEPAILKSVLASPAFYVGAQGSKKTRDDRNSVLAEIGVPDNDIKRISGPIGLIPSVRDPRTLAISVLAEILQEFPRAS